MRHPIGQMGKRRPMKATEQAPAPARTHCRLSGGILWKVSWFSLCRAGGCTEVTAAGPQPLRTTIRLDFSGGQAEGKAEVRGEGSPRVCVHPEADPEL